MIAVTQRLEEVGALTAASVFDGFLRRFMHRQHIHAIRLRRRNVGHPGFLIHVGHGRGFVDRYAHAILVVLAQKDHRQFPQRGQVQALVELAVVGAAVAEEDHYHPVFFGALRGQCQPYGDRQVPGDDGITAPEVLADVGKVHRTAASLIYAGFFAVQFRHQALRIQSAHDGMPVIAIMRHDVILRAQRMNCAHGDGFLADVEMQEAADFALLIRSARLFFKAPDQRHFVIPLLQGRHVYCWRLVHSKRFAVRRSLPRFLSRRCN